MKKMVLGDVHGNIQALKEVFKAAKFDYNKDKLIALGDYVDGHKYSKEVIDELLKVKNIVVIRGNHDCIDVSTRVLTKRGWMTYNNIKEDDKIFSFDTINNKGVWTEINKIIIKDYDDYLIKFDGRQCNMMLTPKHRVLTKKSDKWYYELAENLCGKYTIKTSASDMLEDYSIEDNMLKLIGIILTDGHIDKHGYITIYQSKIKNLYTIRDLLNTLNLKYKEVIRYRDIKEIKNRILIKKVLPQHVFRISAESSRKIPLRDKKYLPTWIYNLSNKQTKILYESLILGDGTFYKSTNGACLYGNRGFLEQIQCLLITKGYRTYLSKNNRGDHCLNITLKNTYIFNTSDKINQGRLTKEKYNGKVWCLNVPFSNFLVERNGTHYFTGNCWFLNFINEDWRGEIWLQQGGANTLRSYGARIKVPDYVSDESIIDMSNLKIPESHKKFLRESKLYHIEDGMLFVHGGFDPILGVSKTPRDVLLWDRSLIQYAKGQPIKGFKKVFIGHTSTQGIDGGTEPVIYNNLVCCDTGAGNDGKLTLWDLDTGKFWQSKRQKALF